MKNLMIGMFLLLATVCEAATFRGTIQKVTPTSIVIITGVGEALRLIRIDINTAFFALDISIKAGDIIEITEPDKGSAGKFTVTKCRTNEFGLVVSCP